MFKLFNNKIFLTFLTIFVSILIAIVVVFNKKSSQLPVIAIANWGPHISLLETIYGVKEELKHVNFEIADVNFDASMIMQVLYKLKAHKPKVIVAIATPVAQVAKNIIKDIPLVFADVTDPVQSGLLKHSNKSLANITGVSDMQDLKAFLVFAKKALPTAKNIGILYSTTEANDAALVKMMKEAVKLHDMHIVALAVNDADDISVNMQTFHNKVDFIYLGTSGIIQKSLPIIASNADQMLIPVFNAHSDAVINHIVLGSFGVNYRKIGHQVANLVKAILNGENIKNIKPVYPAAIDHEVFISKKIATKYGIDIPNDSNVTVVE